MNPRIKKIGRNILFLLSIPGIIGAFVFANTNKQDEKLTGIHVAIENTELSFVTEEDILDLISSKGVVVNQSVINEVKINKLENVIKENEWVKDAEIYITANHALNVNVKQKTPYVRINQTDSIDYAYYLDEHANPIALSQQYIAKVPVVTTPRLGYTLKDLNVKNDLVQLATYVQDDPFWNTMITQINVDKEHHIELIPVLGNHVILIGSVEDLDSKMKRLLAFYQNGIQTIDWNRYNEIDVRFAHQVVARNTAVAKLVDKTLEKEMQDAKNEKMQLTKAEIPTSKTRMSTSSSLSKQIPKMKSTNTQLTTLNSQLSTH